MKQMSSLPSISYSFFKKSIPLYANSSTAKGIPLLSTLNSISFKKFDRQKGTRSSSSSSSAQPLIIMDRTDPSDLPAKSPPEVPTAPPTYKPGTPPEMPRIFIKEPQFDPTPPPPPELPAADPPPAVSPDDFPPPGQPEVIPPRGPDIIPPLSPPEPGEVIIPPRDPTLDPPPHGPDVIPPAPPETGFPHPTQPDIPYPVIKFCTSSDFLEVESHQKF